MSMALPAIKTFADCADWSKTVTPYIPQLYDLPQQITSSITNLEALKLLYISTNPLISGFFFSCALFPLFLVISEANRNWSQVDRVWSILPTVYNVHYAVYAHFAAVPTKRLDTLAFFSIVWSARLTYNYWRKGGYQVGSEDYRWNVIKDFTGAPVFFIFNIVFISSLQSVRPAVVDSVASIANEKALHQTLLFLITTPAYIMLVASKGLGDTQALTDVVFSRTIGLVIFIAYLADNQQWYYYEARNQYRKTAKLPPVYHQEDLDRGFNTTGMFAWSRHPNFAAEQTVWVLVYAWGAYTTRGLVNWTVAGPVCYLLLFQGSTWLTELLSSKKYPDYAEYRRRVGRFLPKLPGGPPGDFSDMRKAKD